MTSFSTQFVRKAILPLLLIVTMTMQVNSFAQCNILPYCAPAHTFGCGIDYISNVTFSTINRSSACDGTGYNLYTTPNPTLTQGSSYTISVTTGGDTEGIRAWIDYNGDGVFNNVTELVLGPLYAGTNPATYTATVVIPGSATVGASRLRVRCNYASAPTDPCLTQTWGEDEDYCVMIAASGPCVGTPAPGNTVSSANPACSGANFTLSLQNPPGGTGLIYQWQSSPNGSTWTNIGGATNATLTTSQLVATYYRCQITCTGNTGYSNALQVTIAGTCQCAAYCIPAHTFGCGIDYISNVTFGTINRTSGCDGTGYNLYTTPNPSFTQGGTYPISITTAGDVEGIRVWIDYNGDGVFNNVTELVLGPLYAGTVPATYTGSVTIPGGATVGGTRMRVRCNYASAPTDPCLTQTYGEVEDFCITIAASGPCAGTPAPGATVASANPVCSAANFTLSLGTPPMGTGLTYQWQSSPNGSSWTNIGGATNATLTTSQITATYYQCLVTCAGNTGTSTPLQVTMAGTCQCAAYCLPANNCGIDYISNVTFATINRSSGCDVYSVYTNPNPTVTQGSSYTISVTTGGDVEGVRAWIDYNGDGIFNNVTELVLGPLYAGTVPATYTATVIIPGGATIGSTRLRVRCNYASAPTDPCVAQTWGETEDYCITIAASGPCVGTPAPGNTVASTNPVCSAANFTLSLQNPPIGSGLTYQWQSSPNGSSWTNIGGATNATLTTSQLVNTYYQCLVTCAGNTGTSTALLVTMAGVCQCAAYCVPTNNCGIDYISNVTFGGINRNSTCDVYSVYTTPNPSFTQGLSYTISVTTGGDTEGVRAWIDYNGDGVFNNVTELILGPAYTGTVPATYTATVTIPGGATVGSTRLRVRCNYASAPTDPCNAQTWGEIEDYCITIAAAAPCAGTPAPGNTLSTANPACNNANFTLSMSTPPNGSGLTYQWQSSPNGSTWTNIAGATNVTCTTSQVAATYYQCVVTCSNGGGIGTSTPILIGTTANAGPDVAICAAGGSTTLNGTCSIVPSNTMTVVISGPGFLDETSWTVTNSLGTIIGSGGIYAFGSTNTIPVTISSPPLSFFLETNGTFNDNTANYQIICNGTVIYSGTVLGTAVGGATGNITISNINCSNVVTYSWSPPTNLSNPNIANPVANPSTTTTYTLTTNASGCIGTDQVTVTISNVSLVVSSQTNVNCFGGNTGNVTLVASGGTSPYQYSINGAPYQPVSAYFNLTAGTYALSTMDANGCTASTSVTIIEPAAALAVGTLTSQNVSCFGGSNGSITIAGTGGTSPYQYQLNAAPYGNSGNFTGLIAGTYSINIKDAYLCTTNTSVTITAPSTGLSSSIVGTNVLCFGNSTGAADLTATGGTGAYTYSWSNGATSQDLTGIPAGTYTVTTTDANLCPSTASITITGPAAALAASIAGTNVLCFGNNTGAADLSVTGGTTNYTYSWSTGATSQDLTGIGVGTYNVTVTDANLCTTPATVTITGPASAITASETHTNALCFGGMGSVTISATGGTGAYTGTGTFSQAAGTTNYTVSDANGCSSSVPVTVTQPAASLLADAGADVTICNGGSTNLNATATGGTSAYGYAWNNGASQGGTVTPNTTTTYTVTVTDANGCTDTDDMTVTVNAVSIVAAPSNGLTYIADYETTDVFGWTHYYDDNGTVGMTCDDYLLLSLQKNGNNIGTIGNGTFIVTVGANPGTTHLTNPPADYVTALDWYAMNRYWLVTPTTQPVTDIPVRFYYTTADFDSVNNTPASAVSAHTDLKFYKINGSGFNPNPMLGHAGVPAAPAYNQPGYWQYNNNAVSSNSTWSYAFVGGTTHYSEYVIGQFSGGGGGGGGAGGAFPVELLSFTGYEHEADNVLEWVTKNESNNKGFRLLKSTDNVTYTPLELVTSQAPNGTSNSELSYQFIDNAPASITYYRLMQIDIDGHSYLHNQTVEITRTGGANSIIVLYPNPAKEELNVSITNPVAKKYTIKVYDVQGKLVITQKEDADYGVHVCKLNISKLAKGAYTVVITNTDEVSSARFIKE